MSGLRITGGMARGRILREPVGRGVRPTSARVREAVFSILGQDLSNTTFLDAYGGSGLMGLEAWSRGAEVTIVERDRHTWRALLRRGEEIEAAWRVVYGDLRTVAGSLGSFDTVFADPPYAEAPSAVLDHLRSLVRDRLVLEADARTEVPDQAAPLRLVRSRVYGGTAIHLYERAEGGRVAGESGRAPV